jgi:hypothetical protein
MKRTKRIQPYRDLTPDEAAFVAARVRGYFRRLSTFANRYVEFHTGHPNARGRGSEPEWGDKMDDPILKSMIDALVEEALHGRPADD